MADKSWQTRRQAVLVIHGMGEQVPLETMRSFVETVYQRDTSLGATVVDDPDLGRVNQVWTVPDTATGSSELRKISTQPRTGDRLRTDFYEFYWADIMEGTPIQAVYEWVRGLILRSPWAVPRSIRVWITFIALWVLSIGAVLNTLATLDPSGAMANSMMTGFAGFMQANHVYVGWLVTALGLFALGVGFAGARAAAGTKRFTLRRHYARVKVGLPVMLVGLGLIVVFAPVEMLGNPKVWSGAMALLSAALLNGIIAPYFGDVVRYVRATPSTVDKRQRIRERGLALLRQLHDKTDRRGGVEEPYYERIIVVAHSLGAIIAYDLIQLYWQAEGPSHLRLAVPGLAGPLGEVDEFVAGWWGTEKAKRKPFDLAAYQALQSRAFEAMVLGGIKFRISDFITLGAPLAHAEFLLKDDKAALEREFEERGLSSSPPRPDRPSRTASYKLGRSGPFAHFAAPFTAVRWTNIFDVAWFPLFGDIVSGPLQGAFGPGIADRRVKITRPGWPPILNRFVTHTLYWSWHRKYATGLPDHIRELREAMQLKGDIEKRAAPASPEGTNPS
jgi:hypothetical protein